MLLHVSRHIETSDFSDFNSIFVRHQGTLQEAVDLVGQASAFDDESVTLNSHFLSLQEHIAATQAWLTSSDLKRLMETPDANFSDTPVRNIVLEGARCGLHTPELEYFQKKLIIFEIEEAAASSAQLSLFSLEILLTVSQNLGIAFPFGKIRFQTTVCDISASAVLQSAVYEHRNALKKVSEAITCRDLDEFSVSFKMFSAAHPMSPMVSLLGFVGRMTEIWKEKALEFLKRSPHDSTSPFLAKTMLGWMHWIRWFSESESISKIAVQLRKLAVDYKQQIAPLISCYVSNCSPKAAVSCTMLLWPIDDVSDLHLSNASGDRETISLQPRCGVMVPLPPRWYTDAAPEVNKNAILNRIKKLGGQIIASKISCRRRECNAKALTSDSFCSDKCAVQFEFEALEIIENTRIKRRAAARDALSRALSLSYRGATAAPDAINRLSAAIESSFLRAVPTSAEVLPESYFARLKDRILQIRSFSPGCVRAMITRGIADEAILNHLSAADVGCSTPVASASASTPTTMPSLPSLSALPALPSLPELSSSNRENPKSSSRDLKQGSSRKRKDDAEPSKDSLPPKSAKLNDASYSISISGTASNELCHLNCVRNQHHHDVDMASLPPAIVVQGRLAPAAVASFVNQVSSVSSSSKFVAVFQISSVAHSGCPQGLLGHVRSLVSMDRVAVAPLGDDCQVIGKEMWQHSSLFRDTIVRCTWDWEANWLRCKYQWI